LQMNFKRCIGSSPSEICATFDMVRSKPLPLVSHESKDSS